MGFFDKIFSFFTKKKKKLTLVFCGLDNAGKSTIINFLKPKKKQELNVAPTVGYSVENFMKNNINFHAFDMSGQEKYRSMWETVLSESNGIIFVIDSTDQVRMAVAQSELIALIENKYTRKKPILFFANKMDLQGSLTASEVSEKIELHTLKQSWQIFSSNAKKGIGIEEGLLWLSDELQKNNPKKK